MELVKDYDCVFNSHRRKAYTVADASSTKSTNLVTLSTIQNPLYIEIQKFEYEIILKSLIGRLTALSLQRCGD